MPQRSAHATWNGTLPRGDGRMRVASGAFDVPFSFGTRMGDEAGTNPEELIGAALAGCFSMALAAGLGKAGHTPTRIATDAKVHFEQQGGGFAITHIDLTTDADVPGVDDAAFQAIAEATKKGCPVSKALTGTEIRLQARLRATAAG